MHMRMVRVRVEKMSVSLDTDICVYVWYSEYKRYNPNLKYMMELQEVHKHP